MSIENHSATMSFDRMRSMLVRAAEIRDSEQQQIFDVLDEIHAQLSPLESIGSLRKRLSELPDRTEVSVLAERLDETLAKLEAQDSVLAALTRAVEAVVDRLAKPFAELGGRLDGIAGRFEGVAGRMGGVEDRVAGLHKRIDDLDHHMDKQDTRLDGLPSAVYGPVRERLDTLEGGVTRSVTETATHFDPAARLEALTARLDSVGTRVGALESGVTTRLTELESRLGGSIDDRPDVEALTSLIRSTNRDSELRNAAQLDEAMATFAELILGGGEPTTAQPAPRPVGQRRTRKAVPKAREPSADGPETSAPA